MPLNALVKRPWLWRTKIESDFTLGVDSLYVALSFKSQCRIENLKSVLKIRILADTTQTTL